MAPRTREQQDAYNAKRRAEVAASKKEAAPAKVAPPDKPKGRKAEAVSDPKPAKGKVKTNRGTPHVPAPRAAAPKVIVPRTKKLTLEEIKAIQVPRAVAVFEVPSAHLDKIAEMAGVKPAKLNKDGSVPPRKIAPVNMEMKARAKKHDLAKQVETLGADSLLPPSKNPEVAQAKRNLKKIGSARTAPINTANERDASRERLAGKITPLVIHDDDDVVVTRRVVSPPNKVVVGDGAPAAHTMAKSYLRSGAPGKGKLRNGTYQCTTAFTEAQMLQVQAAATFRGVSLAEFIRSCVVAHLNPLSAAG